MLGRETRLDPYSCPTCRKAMDAATGIGNNGAPTPGSVSVCAYCAELLIFTDILSVRRMEVAEEFALPDEVWKLLFDLRDGILRKRGRDGSHLTK